MCNKFIALVALLVFSTHAQMPRQSIMGYDIAWESIRVPSHDDEAEKFMVIVVPSYNNKTWWKWNLQSLLEQEYSHYHIIITDDCSNDGMGDAIELYIKENKLQHRITFIKNQERHGALYNLYMMIHSCPDDTIILTVDGDDALPDPYTLKRLNAYYSSGEIWLTYGQFKEYPSGAKGWCSPYPDAIVRKSEFREFNHIPSHLRTFYAWLFKAIKLEDMLYLGDFYPMTWDYVMMLPMIEMAGERHQCIQDIMYMYNNANTISDHQVSRQLQAYLAQIVRNKEKYDRLPMKQEFFHQSFEHEKADMIIFSENSPQALQIFIESIKHKLTGVADMYVIYHAKTSTNKNRYEILQSKFPEVLFFEVLEYRENFRELLVQAYGTLKNNYIIFAQDHWLINETVDIGSCIQALEKTQAYGFYLFLSKLNPVRSITPRLPLLDLGADVCAWNFANANDIWSCANTITMTLYRKTILSQQKLRDLAYMVPTPSGFQFTWANDGDLDKVGLCFKYPKVSKGG